MKLYRSSVGYWINLSLCHRFYIEEDGDNFDIKAAIDCSDDQQIIFILEEGCATFKEAQTKLDKIMMNFNGMES